MVTGWCLRLSGDVSMPNPLAKNHKTMILKILHFLPVPSNAYKRFFWGCLDGVWEGLDDVWMVSVGNQTLPLLRVPSNVYTRLCLGVSGWCLDGVWMVSGWFLDGV